MRIDCSDILSSREHNLGLREEGIINRDAADATFFQSIALGILLLCRSFASGAHLGF